MKTNPMIALFALAVLSQSALPQTTERDAEKISPVVDSAARTFLTNGQTIGLSIGIYKDGKTYTYHFGSTERGRQHLPTDKTLYCIGSITKTFTGLLLAQAVVAKGKRRR